MAPELKVAVDALAVGRLQVVLVCLQQRPPKEVSQPTVTGDEVKCFGQFVSEAAAGSHVNC